MGYTKVALEEKLLEIYPEITKHNLSLSLDFSEDKDAWIVKLKKGRHELTTHLEKKDADACMEGTQCVYLGVQIWQLIKNIED